METWIVFSAGLSIGVIGTPPCLYAAAKMLYHCPVCMFADKAKSLSDVWLFASLALTASSVIPALYGVLNG